MRFPIIDDIVTFSGRDSRNRMRRGVLLRALEALAGSVPYVALYLALIALMEGQMSSRYLALLLAVTVAAYVLQYACGLFADRHSFIDGYATTCDLRLALADHLRRLPLGDLTRRATGDLTHVVAETVQMVEELLTHLLPVLIGQLCVPLFMGALLFLVDWRLGLAAFITVPIAVSIMLVLRARFRALHQRRVRLLATVSTHLLEYVQGIRVIRSFGLAGERFARLDTALRDLQDSSIRIEIFGGLAFYSFAIALEAGFVVLIVYGSYLVLGDMLSLTTFIVAMVLSQRFYMPLIEATSSLAMVSYLTEGVRRIRDVTAIPALPEARGSIVPSGQDVVFDDVHFGYEDGADVLSGVSCHVPACTLTAIVGPSGAGKSTLLHLVARFHDVRRGAIRVGGQDIRDLRLSVLMDALSIVFQDVYLFAGTVADNIRLGSPEATDAEMRAAAEMAYCSEFIERFPQGYETVVGEGGATLSGGERQRLSIARALLKRSPIVLLDEATASVDPLCERALRTAIDRLSRTRTVIVVAHRLETVRRADQILVLENGCLAETGRHETLIGAGRCYARLWRQLEHNQHATDDRPAITA